jgi:hypothetical protein
MAFQYHILEQSHDPKLCIVTHHPPTLKKAWLLDATAPLGDAFPLDATYKVDLRAGHMVADILPNFLLVLMVSGRMRALMEEADIKNVEYLRFSLLDKKRKPVGQDFYIAHLIGSVDCFDAERSKVRMSHIRPGQIADIYRLNLLLDKIPPEQKLFRLQQRPATFIIRSDFLQVLQAQGITGYRILNLDTDVII